MLPLKATSPTGMVESLSDCSASGVPSTTAMRSRWVASKGVGTVISPFGVIGIQRHADLAVVIDIVKPEVAHFVGDDRADAEQVEQGGGGHLEDLFAQTAIGRKHRFRRKQGNEGVVTLQGQGAAVVAVDSRDVPEQRQIGDEQFLHLLGDDQVVEGGFIELRVGGIAIDAAPNRPCRRGRR